MKVDRIAGYSGDFKEFLLMTGTYYCTVPIDFDFAINCPDMENRVYYKKKEADRVRERLNRLGVFLMFWYDIKSREVLKITVRYDAGCMVEYEGQQDIETIVDNLIAYKEGKEQGSEEFEQEEYRQTEQCAGASL